MKKIQVQGLHHITVVGSTKQVSIDFWHGLLGMPSAPSPLGTDTSGSPSQLP